MQKVTLCSQMWVDTRLEGVASAACTIESATRRPPTELSRAPMGILGFESLVGSELTGRRARYENSRMLAIGHDDPQSMILFH
jgi:hypothetical protein